MDAKELQREQLAKARRTIREHRARQTQFPAKRLSVASACTTRSQKYQYLAEPFVESSLFEFGTGVVIVYSTLTMMLEVDQVEVPFLINFSESFLTSFFLSEWLVRLSVHGPSWLRSIENLLDTFIAWIPGVLTVWFLQPLVAESTGFLKTMRIVRMLRLLRLVKVFRNLPMMQDLWMLVRGLLKSGSTLVSALVLIIFTLYVFGIAAVDLIGKADYTGAAEDVQVAQQRFFGLWYSMLTLIRFLHADDSQGIMDELLQQQPYIWIFLWMFTACASLVLLNLITAIVCNEAFETSKNDEADLAKQLMLQKEEEINRLKDEFTSGMQALSGLATAKDMVILTKGMERIEKQVRSLMKGALAKGPTKDMLQNQMTQVRVDLDARLRRSEGSLKDLVSEMKRLSAQRYEEVEAMDE